MPKIYLCGAQKQLRATLKPKKFIYKNGELWFSVYDNMFFHIYFWVTVLLNENRIVYCA